MPRSPIHAKRPGGYSLLELVLAVALVGGTLAPALALLRDGIELSRRIDQRQLLANYAVQELERRLALVAAGWPRAEDEISPNDPGQTSTGQQADRPSPAGFPEIHFLISWSDQVADGGLPERLMDIQATAYIDENGDDALGPDEPQSTFATKISQLETYVSRAAN